MDPDIISWLQLLLDESECVCVCVCVCVLVIVLGCGLVGSADGMAGLGERGQVRMRVVAVHAHLPASHSVQENHFDELSSETTEVF